MVKKVRRSNVKDGILLPLGNGFSLVKGDHPNKVDDVDIGPNNKNGLSVNHGEILQQQGDTLRVFSAEPMFGGISPTQLLYGGLAPDKVFAMQEQWKKVNKINDDGSRRAKLGTEEVVRNKQTWDTILNDEQESAFNDWYKNISSKLKLNSNPNNYEHGYDYRGYWLENKDNNIDYSAKDFHFPDKYKKPNHETFSNESIYATEEYGIDPKSVGYWKNNVFIPGSFNILMKNDNKNSLDKEGFYYSDDKQLSSRQRYAESSFNDKALNKYSKAAGAYQIMPHIYKAYVKATGHEGDLYDLEYNTAIRNWLMEDINKNAHIKDSRNNNRNKIIKTYAAYNWGSGNLGKLLKRLEKESVDTFNSYDWIDKLPKETKDYVNFIVHGDNVNNVKNSKKYKEALDSLRTKKEFGGEDNIPMRIDSNGNLIDSIQPSVVTAKLPAKFNGSQAAAARYAEGYKFGKNVAKRRDNVTKQVVEKVLPININKDLDDNVLGYTPIAGDILQSVQGIKDISKGNYLKGAASLGLLAVPNIIEKPVKGLAKGITYTFKENKAFIKQFNEFAEKFGYPKITTSPNHTKKINDQVIKTLDRHNTFLRGVVMPTKKEYDIIKKQFPGITDDEILEYVATNPFRDYRGLSFVSSDSRAITYGAGNKNLSGKTFYVQRPYKLGTDRTKWIEEASFPLYTTGSDPATMKLADKKMFKKGDVIYPWGTKDVGHPGELMIKGQLKSKGIAYDNDYFSRQFGILKPGTKEYDDLVEAERKLYESLTENTSKIFLGNNPEEIIYNELYKHNFKFGGQTNINSLGERPNAKYGKEMKNKRNKAERGGIQSIGSYNFPKPFIDKYGNTIGINGTISKLATPSVNTGLKNPPKINSVGGSTAGGGPSAKGIGIGAAIVDSLGAIGASLIQQNAINNRKSPTYQYTLLDPVKLKTKINIAPQIARMKEMRAKLQDAAIRTSGSSRDAYSRILAGHNNLLQSAMNLYGQKENIETELINRDLLNQQQTRQANAKNVVDAVNNTNAARIAMRNKGLVDTSNNWTSALNTIRDRWLGPEGFVDRENARTVKAADLYTQAIANPDAARLIYGNIDFTTDANKRKAFNTIYNFLNNNRLG